MRWTTPLVLAAVGALAVPAFAHGGGAFRDPPGISPPGVSEPWGGPPLPPPQADGGPVMARVVDGGGKPVAGAWIWSEGRHVATADAESGRFRCAPLRYPARLVVTTADHAPLLTRWITAPAPGGYVDLGDIVLAAGEAIAGDIVGAASATDLRLRVVPDRPRVPEVFAIVAEVTRWDSVRVRRGGSFAFHGLPPGLYRVLLTMPGGREIALAERVAPGGARLRLGIPEVPALPAARSPDPPPGGVLVLTGIGDRIVRVVDRARGRRLFGRREDGVLTVAAPRDAVLDVVTGDDAGLDAPLEGLRAGQTVALPPPGERGAIAGIVVRADGSPVVHARVRVSSAADAGADALSRDVETDASGRFVVHGVSGLLRVAARAPGLTSDERPCRVVAGDRAVLVIVSEERIAASVVAAGVGAER